MPMQIQSQDEKGRGNKERKKLITEKGYKGKKRGRKYICRKETSKGNSLLYLAQRKVKEIFTAGLGLIKCNINHIHILGECVLNGIEDLPVATLFVSDFFRERKQAIALDRAG